MNECGMHKTVAATGVLKVGARHVRFALGAIWGWLSATMMGVSGAEVLPRRDTNVVEVRVLAVCYDPVLSGQGGKTLREHFRWNDPRKMTPRLLEYLTQASGGFARYTLAEWVDVKAFPKKRDGFRYTEESFLAMWKDRDRAHQPDAVSYEEIFKDARVVERMRTNRFEEVWVWGAPYFGTDEYAMKIPQDQVYYPTRNPWFYRPYDIPDVGKTLWVMGFNYEVGEDNALHSFGHRVEGILSLTVGRGVWDPKVATNNVWNRFTRQASEFPDDAQVGNVHGGPNAKSGYDYGQTNRVLSAADDWKSYPHLTGVRKWVDCETWGGPQYHLNYMKWWLDHLPKNEGVTDGFYNNWWRYVVDYDRSVRALPPPGGKLHKPKMAMY